MGAADDARVLVVGGSPEATGADTLRALERTCDVTVAVDHGLDSLLAAGLGCDLYVGDADSVSPTGACLVRACERGEDGPVREVARFDPHKDDTDLGLALRIVSERWPRSRVVCTCLSGGRPDHALAALGQLARIPAGAALEEDGCSARVLHAGQRWEIEGRSGATFSFVPVAPDTVVSERGMRWELDRHPAALLDDVGISNVIEAPRATITCHTGTLIAWLFK